MFYNILTDGPVWKAKGEKLETGWSEEQLPVLLAEIVVAGDLVAELEDDVDGGGEEAVELWDPGRLHRDQPLLGLELLLLQLHVLQHNLSSGCEMVAVQVLQLSTVFGRVSSHGQQWSASRYDYWQLNNILSPIWEC